MSTFKKAQGAYEVYFCNVTSTSTQILRLGLSSNSKRNNDKKKNRISIQKLHEVWQHSFVQLIRIRWLTIDVWQKKWVVLDNNNVDINVNASTLTGWRARSVPAPTPKHDHDHNQARTRWIVSDLKHIFC